MGISLTPISQKGDCTIRDTQYSERTAVSAQSPLMSSCHYFRTHDATSKLLRLTYSGGYQDKQINVILDSINSFTWRQIPQDVVYYILSAVKDGNGNTLTSDTDIRTEFGNQQGNTVDLLISCSVNYEDDSYRIGHASEFKDYVISSGLVVTPYVGASVSFSSGRYATVGDPLITHAFEDSDDILPIMDRWAQAWYGKMYAGHTKKEWASTTLEDLYKANDATGRGAINQADIPTWCLYGLMVAAGWASRVPHTTAQAYNTGSVIESRQIVGDDGVIRLPFIWQWNEAHSCDIKQNAFSNDHQDILKFVEIGDLSTGWATPNTVAYHWYSPTYKSRFTNALNDIGNIRALSAIGFDGRKGFYGEMEYPVVVDFVDGWHSGSAYYRLLSREDGVEIKRDGFNLLEVSSEDGTTIKTHVWDATVGWFDVTAPGKSTHDTYGYGANYGRTNANMTKSVFCAAIGSTGANEDLDEYSSDQDVLDYFTDIDAYDDFAISANGYIVLPKGYHWMNPGAANTNISFKDAQGRIWKYVTSSGSNGKFRDVTFTKAESAITVGVYDRYVYGLWSARYRSALVTDEDILSTYSDNVWGYPTDSDTAAYFQLERIYGTEFEWEYITNNAFSPSSTTPSALILHWQDTDGNDVDRRFVWNTTTKCFVDTRFTVSSYKSVTDSTLDSSSAELFPENTVFVDKGTLGNYASADDYYIVLPPGYTWVNTTAGNYSIKRDGVTWTCTNQTSSATIKWTKSGTARIAVIDGDGNKIYANETVTLVIGADMCQDLPVNITFSQDVFISYEDMKLPGYYQSDSRTLHQEAIESYYHTWEDGDEIIAGISSQSA